MTHVESVEITNVRRFAEFCKIELGLGATIVIAPNGYGKTTIFESIEVALTGKVGRVENLANFVSDGLASARVGLHLSDGSFISTDINSRGEIERKGDWRHLLGTDVNEDSIPFLIRLTHLLDQRTDQWNTQIKSSEAGEQLAKRPDNREISIVSNRLIGIRRRLTTEGNSVQSRLQSRRAELLKWETLLAERDLVLEESLDSDMDLAKLLNQSEVLCEKEQFWEEYNGPQSAIEFLERASTQARNQIREIEELLSRQKQLLPVVEDYERCRKLTTSLEGKNAENSRLLSEIQLIIQAHYEQLSLETSSKSKEENALAGLQATLSNLKEMEKLDRDRQQALEEMSLFQVKLKPLSEELQILTEQSREERTKADKIASLQTQVSDLNLRIARWASDESQAQRWKHLAAERDQLTARLTADAVNVQAKQQDTDEARARMQKCETEVAFLRRQVQALQSSTDTIRSAVSTLSINLPAGQTRCPACGTHFQIDELRQRLGESISLADPALAEMLEHLRIKEIAHHELSERMLQLESEASRVRDEVNAIHQSLDRVVGDIAGVSSYFTLVGKTAVEVLSHLVALRAEIDSDVHQTMAELELQSQGFSPSHLAELDNRIADLSRTEVQVRRELEKATDQLKATIDSIKLLDFQLEESVSELETKISVVTDNLAQIVHTVNDLSNKIAQQKLLLESTEVDRQQIYREKAANEEEIRALLSKWTGAGLSGNPQRPALEAALASHPTKKRTLLEKIGRIDETIAEIRSFQRWEALQRCNEKIDRERGDFTISEFSAKLRSIVESTERNFERVVRAQEAAICMADALAESIKEQHTRLKLIEPLRIKLLKRLMVDSRFEASDLDLALRRRKEHLEITIPINGRGAPIREVASQAQSANVQLSFLLAMALGQPWCSWRALLLDDPTQNHDLVHASALFDVLRDLVVDCNFQLLYATHDSNHGTFLRRKLENDNIPVKVYRLEHTATGVVPRLETS